MQIDKYLIIKANKYAWKSPKVEIKERLPITGANEIALRLRLEVPNELFQRPYLEAIMKVPTEAVPKIKITPNIVTNIEKIIKENIGLNMKVNIIEQEQEEKENKDK